jgi:phosphatidylglycerol---prolipoprotein diacylglyceryl transferase
MPIPYPRIPPDAVHIGPFRIRWYGVMYFIGYVVGVFLARRRIARGRSALDVHQIDSLVTYAVIGMLIGARVIYMLVYARPDLIAHPLSLFAIWQGGLSFHGAILGMAIASLLFARRIHVPWLTVTDTIAVCGTPGLFFGRLGNFINAELYGRVTNVPWAMVFPTDPSALPRHPSQLYEAIGEGLIVASIIWWVDARTHGNGSYRPGILTATFLIAYGTIRFLIEFTRQPDPQLGFVLGPFSMGQLLCVLMILVGVALIPLLRGAPQSTSTPSRDPAAHPR